MELQILVKKVAALVVKRKGI